MLQPWSKSEAFLNDYVQAKLPGAYLKMKTYEISGADGTWDRQVLYEAWCSERGKGPKCWRQEEKRGS